MNSIGIAISFYKQICMTSVPFLFGTGSQLALTVYWSWYLKVNLGLGEKTVNKQW